MTRALVGACVASLVVSALAGDVTPPAARRFESTDHRVAVDVPAAWTVEQRPSDHAAISLHVAASDAAPEFDLDVFHTAGFLDARCQAFCERELEPERFEGAKKGEVTVDPVPRLVMSVKENGRDETRAWFYRVLDRNGFTMTVRCEPSAWPTIAAACGDAALSLTSAIPEWPERPAGYVASERDGYEYVVQPGVADADVAALHAAILDLEKKYAKTRAPVPKPRDRRPVVVVSADAKSSRVAAGAAKVEDEFVANVAHGRLFAVPLRRDDARQRALLARATTELFHAQTFGADASPWLVMGESRLAPIEATGHFLPWLPDDCALPKTVDSFERLVHDPSRGAFEQATVYVAFFRAGARPWRDAFAAFLKDLAATGDWDAAERKHLLSLDQEKLLAAAQAYLKQLRSANAK